MSATEQFIAHKLERQPESRTIRMLVRAVNALYCQSHKLNGMSCFSRTEAFEATIESYCYNCKTLLEIEKIAMEVPK